MRLSHGPRHWTLVSVCGSWGNILAALWFAKHLSRHAILVVTGVTKSASFRQFFILFSYLVISQDSSQLMKLAFNRKSDSELRMQFQPFPLVFPLIVLAFFSRFSGAAFHIWNLHLAIFIRLFAGQEITTLHRQALAKFAVQPTYCIVTLHMAVSTHKLGGTSRWYRTTSSQYGLLSQQICS